VLERTSGGAPLVGRTWLVEGWAQRELGDPAAAVELHRLALAHEERHYDRDHPEAGFAAMQLGLDHEALGDHEEARRWYADALDRYRRAGVVDARATDARAALDRLEEGRP
jgi:tetratricopeptide (TPR) repeat protein